MGTAVTDHAQAGYSGSRARSLGHDKKSFSSTSGGRNAVDLGLSTSQNHSITAISTFDV